MKCVSGSFVAETEVKRSRFIAHLVPYSVFDGLQQQLKEEHPKANHVVYATRHINEYGQIVENSSDDGEPKGCAGQPVLNVLRGVELVDVAILIVRYFGGIKLGTGGMVRAYSAAAKAVIAHSELREWQRLVRFPFRSDYTAQRQILYHLERLGISPGTPRFEMEEIVWNVEVPNDLLNQLQEKLGRLIRSERLSPPA